jgi:hypothetical protein
MQQVHKVKRLRAVNACNSAHVMQSPLVPHCMHSAPSPFGCRFDHIYGIYRTTAGRVRRIDIIAVPPSEWAFALVGWIGSRQFNRLMRQHAHDLGMRLSSHG